MQNTGFTNDELNILSHGLLCLLDNIGTAKGNLPYVSALFHAYDEIDAFTHEVQGLHSKVCDSMSEEPAASRKYYLFDNKDTHLIGEYTSLEEAKEKASLFSETDSAEADYSPYRYEITDEFYSVVERI